MTEPTPQQAAEPPFVRLLARWKKFRAERAERNAPGEAMKKFIRRMHWLVRWGTLAYLVTLPICLLLVEWCGERSMIVSVLLYVPPQGWMLPLAVLTPLSLLFRPKFCWLHLLAVVVILCCFMRFHWSSWPEPKGRTLTIVTANLGQRKLHSLNPFFKSQEPDVIAYQDASGFRKVLQHENPDATVAAQNQFLLVSKLPVKNSGLVPGLVYRGKPCAAWFELESEGRPLIIYNIHMPTPRPVFTDLRGRGFLVELIGGKGIYCSEARTAFGQYWDERLRLTDGLIEVLRNEKRPFIVVGDFNMPDHGKIYHQFKSEFTDVFAAKGCGFGLTFPGLALRANPLTIFGPWLRIDYIFADKTQRPIYCRVEPRQSAQHRAVAAMFEMGPAK